MLVLMLLIIVVSLIVPSLEKFFGGRTLDAEVRQFVSLTHYAQSRAVSEGVPMVLWVDPAARTYGLEQEAGYNDGDPKAVDYSLGEGVTMSLGNNASKVTKRGKLTGLHFSPDGNVITATSVAGVSFQSGKDTPVWVMPSANGLSYEVHN
jgi:Tfp pilus assembly protein FimT